MALKFKIKNCSKYLLSMPQAIMIIFYVIMFFSICRFGVISFQYRNEKSLDMSIVNKLMISILVDGDFVGNQVKMSRCVDDVHKYFRKHKKKCVGWCRRGERDSMMNRLKSVRIRDHGPEAIGSGIDYKFRDFVEVEYIWRDAWFEFYEYRNPFSILHIMFKSLPCRNCSLGFLKLRILPPEILERS